MKWFIIFILAISVISTEKSLSHPLPMDNETITIYEEPIPEKEYQAQVYGSIFSGYWSNRNKFYYW